MAAAYLATYGEPDACWSEQIPGRFAHAVVIPAYGEGDNLHAMLRTLQPVTGPVCAIVVLNATAAAPAWAHAANTRLWNSFAQGASTLTAASVPPLLLRDMPFGLLVVVGRHVPDHCLPAGNGVGLARKIGGDLALALHLRGAISGGWLHYTDADVLLPADYLAHVDDAPPDAVAACHAFTHHLADNPVLAEAAHTYEVSLRYLVLGLRHAKSPYAYHTIGSTIAVRFGTYVKVRGMAKRLAAEDFYFLDKVRKTGRIAAIGRTPLQLSGRISQRVPFGTGKALWQHVTGDQAPIRLYHPETFAYLQAALQTLTCSAVTGVPHASDIPLSKPHLLQVLLDQMGCPSAIQRATAQSADATRRRRCVHTWFDALRTLRFMHLLRSAGWPMLPWEEALAQAPFLSSAARQTATMTPAQACAALAADEAAAYVDVCFNQ